MATSGTSTFRPEIDEIVTEVNTIKDALSGD